MALIVAHAHRNRGVSNGSAHWNNLFVFFGVYLQCIGCCGCWLSRCGRQKCSRWTPRWRRIPWQCSRLYQLLSIDPIICVLGQPNLLRHSRLQRRWHLQPSFQRWNRRRNRRRHLCCSIRIDWHPIRSTSPSVKRLCSLNWIRRTKLPSLNWIRRTKLPRLPQDGLRGVRLTNEPFEVENNKKKHHHQFFRVSRASASTFVNK